MDAPFRGMRLAHWWGDLGEYYIDDKDIFRAARKLAYYEDLERQTAGMIARVTGRKSAVAKRVSAVVSRERSKR